MWPPFSLLRRSALQAASDPISQGNAHREGLDRRASVSRGHSGIAQAMEEWDTTLRASREMKMSMWRTIATILLCLGACCFATRGLAQTNQGPSLSLSDDHTRMIGRLSGNPPGVMSLDSTQVEQMMSRLAELRASMIPPRPMTDPPPGGTIIVPNLGRWFVQTDPQKPQDVILMILHPGYGWVALRLGPEQMRRFNATLRGFESKP